MSSYDPSTCLLLSTSRDNPIHLWDAYSGQLLATYRAYNYADEVISANSINFSRDGTKIYCGFEKFLRVFDTSSPGRVCQTKQTYCEKTGQKGIISCIAVNPYNPKIIAFGSYDKSIGFYEDSDLTEICVILGQKGGLTHLQFSADGNRLYSGGRKDSEILCWDIRNIGTVLFVIKREVNTNQRIYFDLSPDCQHFATGNDSGIVSVYDLNQTKEVLEPINTFEAHKDCVNGVSFHPSLPVLTTSSGQRKFTDVKGVDDSDSDHSSDGKQTEENSVKFWWI